MPERRVSGRSGGKAQEAGASLPVRRFTLVAAIVGVLFLTQSHAQKPESPSVRYERAQAFARAGAPEAALVELDALLAEFPNDADYLLGRAQMQARLGRDAAAVETAERALRIAPGYEDVWQLRLRLAERAGDDAAVAALRAEVAARFPEARWWQSPAAPVEFRRWLSAGSGTDRLSNGAPDWSREHLRLDWQTAAAGQLFAELSHSARFEESDSSLHVGGLWDALPEWQLGAGVAVTQDARFLPQRELSFDATRGWARGWGTVFSVRDRDYATGDVSTLSVTGEKYVSDYRIAYRLDHSYQADADSALTHALVLNWYPSDKRSFGVTLGAGEEIEIIGLDQLLRTSVANVTLTGSQKLSARLALSWWLGTHEQGDFYRRDYVGLAVRIGL
jgi:YaiO family outer membrane protein